MVRIQPIPLYLVPSSNWIGRDPAKVEIRVRISLELQPFQMNEIIGQCPICDRDMWKNVFVDQHHFIPRCKGGRETKWVHKICHRKVHSVFSEKELAREYYDPIKIKSHPEMERFINWISKKDPGFYDFSVSHSRKRS